MARLLTHEQAKRADRALTRSSVEGGFFGAMVGLGDQFVGAYAVALRTTSFELGMLTALPMLFGALGNSQSFRVARLLGTRKRVIILFAFLQGVMWLPILALGAMKTDYRAEILIGCATFYAVFGAIIAPCWNSVMGEVVPPRVRGKYFSRRSRVGTLSTLGALVLGGLLIHLLRDKGLFGFAMAFLGAFAFRMISVTLLRSLMELHTSVRTDESIPLRHFVRNLPRTNLGRTMLYVMLINFAVNLSGPHFTPYMLRELHMNYLVFTLLTLATPLGAVFTVTHWGAVADRFGNRKALSIAGCLVCFVPWLWLGSTHVWYLGLIQVFSGIAWAGFNLTSVNFLFDSTTDSNRTAYLALFNAAAGAMGALGALLGGVILPHLPPVLGSSTLAIFAMSGTLRIGITVGLLPRIHEVRHVALASAAEIFHTMVSGHPTHYSPMQGRMSHFNPMPVSTVVRPMARYEREIELEAVKDRV